MPFTLSLPKLSPTMEEGTIVKWHKKVNDLVEAGDLLFEVSTDKATVEYNALDTGYLRKILINDGQSAEVNEPVAIFTENKEESIEGFALPKIVKEAPQPAQVAQEAPKEEKKVETKVSRTMPAFVPEKPLEHYEFEHPLGPIIEKVKASPLAKRLAKERGLDLSTVKGTGPGHRVVSRDLQKAQPLTSLSFAKEVPSIAPGTYEEESPTQMRKVIAQRLQEAKSFIPHFYIQQAIDAFPLFSIREQLLNQGLKFTFNDFIIRACALVLRKYPNINSGFNSVNETIIRFKTIDISVAVSVEAGLITPIIRNADYKSISEISAESKYLSTKARENKLVPHEYKGGSFTISNLGMFGVTDFQAIINPPQAAILAVSGIQDIPIVKNGIVSAGKGMNITLSVDHRVIDGVAAAEFIKTLQKTLENPAILLV